MNAYWRRLGLEPTDDVRAIKRAYAARLKHTRPDDDAAAYQALREAYDWALGHARWLQAHADDADTDDPPVEPDPDPAPAPTAHPEPPAAPARLTALMQADRLSALCAAQLVVCGEAAAQPRHFCPAETNSVPLAHARWWRHRVPEHAARYVAPAVPAAEDAPPSIDPESLMQVLRRACEDLGPTGIDAYADTLATQLDALPLWAQDAVQRDLVFFVLEEERLAPDFVLGLATRFGWGQDFRLEQQLGEPTALRLYARLKDARKTPAAPAGLPVAPPEQRFRQLLHTARCHDTGRFGRFALRVLLSPLALFDEAHRPEARALLEADGLDWREITSWSRFALMLTLLALSVGLAWLQSPASPLAVLPAVTRPFNLIVAGALSFLLFRWLPGPQIAAWHARQHGHAVARWVVRERHGWKLSWMAFFLIWALAITTVNLTDTLAAAGGTEPIHSVLAGVVVMLLVGLLLFLVWPVGEAWGDLILPAGFAASAVAASALDGPFAGAAALPIGFGWVLTAVIFMRRAPVLSERFIAEPFSLLRPSKPWGWIIFVIAIKGVLAFYAAVFLLGAPVFLLAYARLAGPMRAYLALCCAAVLLWTGGLGLDGWAAILWLQAVLFVLVRLGWLSGWLLSRPMLSAR
ncbi:MAG: hypothetical protein FHP94_02475 [Denitromonas halophila]|nr:MAG: hypothetical protein FHP94_02475 [Denitromonas halophila]TVT71338.1 MAG: hypothetical protein FHP93_10870 [Denitromonas halophila]